ncbi:beta-phosphoglucomutase [Clostridium aestuarii]|uniref:Beta-phosphoglucomutase n=1 Tax=Clostridium aestuarii TaxID=338193 RepID=A0ABT4D0W1_9CLOT|nr:beta-phosphoglucomutase [Clostridium aestuarii]MCY6484866.1 beta-phosphoglucomutase [Clostridium aestuarii]
MTKIKACIFDLDGVLVDTAKYHFLAWKKLADELNIEFTKKHNERLKGVSRMRSLEIILEIGGIKLDDETKLQLAEKKNSWYVAYISKLTADEILPGVEEFLKLAKSNNLKLALGSASKNSMLILNNLKLVDYFDSIIDGTKVSKAKPNPEVFLKGAAELKIKPEHCVVFEDAEAGIEAAVNAGMHSIGIGSPEILSKADLVISGLHEMNLDKLCVL